MEKENMKLILTYLHSDEIVYIEILEIQQLLDLIHTQ